MKLWFEVLNFSFLRFSLFMSMLAYTVLDPNWFLSTSCFICFSNSNTCTLCSNKMYKISQIIQILLHCKVILLLLLHRPQSASAEWQCRNQADNGEWVKHRTIVDIRLYLLRLVCFDLFQKRMNALLILCLKLIRHGSKPWLMCLMHFLE